MREYANLPVSRRADNGGVHINSGIPNFVAYKIGTALGRDKVGAIYYRALTQYLTPRAKFVDAANASIRAAQELYGANEAAAVRKAFADVGVIPGTASSDPTAQRPLRLRLRQCQPAAPMLLPMVVLKITMAGSKPPKVAQVYLMLKTQILGNVALG